MLDWLRTLWGSKPQPQPQPFRGSRFYAGAQLSRLVSFSTALESADVERKRDLLRLRAHARDLAKNNAYAARYAQLCSTHIVGPDGMTLESEVTGNLQRPKEPLNQAIKAEWAAWGRACTPDGIPWVDLQQVVAETASTDGEVLVRFLRGASNPWGFQVELIDADRLDHTWNAELANGSRIVMGVEQDAFGRAVAYHLWSGHPSEYLPSGGRVRVPAGEIIHVYRKDRARASRGIPWASPVMLQLNLLGRYWEAEAAAANAEADRLAFLKSDLTDMGDQPNPMEAEIQSEHATFIPLPPGVDAVVPPLQHPNSAFDSFTKAMLKGISSGLGVAYHSLSGDVGDANYSSARVALLEERDNWRKLQGWFSRSFCDPIFRAWLEMAVLSGRVKVPSLDWERACAPRWVARSWDWVDPTKDVAASVESIKWGLSTYQEELAALGLDYRKVFAQRAAEQELAKSLGLDLGEPKPADPVAPAPIEPPEEEGGNDATED